MSLDAKTEGRTLLTKIYDNIYGNNMETSLKIVRDGIKLLTYNEDNILSHPFCHESAHQCLTNIKYSPKNEKYLKQHKIRVEIFKIIWNNAIKKNILNDKNYRDKYGLTAIQRLLSNIPKKLVNESDNFKNYSINYDVIDPDIASWIKENIEIKYKLDLKPKKKSSYSSSFSSINEDIYPIDYYGIVTENGKIVRDKPIKIAWEEEG